MLKMALLMTSIPLAYNAHSSHDSFSRDHSMHDAQTIQHGHDIHHEQNIKPCCLAQCHRQLLTDQMQKSGPRRGWGACGGVRQQAPQGHCIQPTACLSMKWSVQQCMRSCIISNEHCQTLQQCKVICRAAHSTYLKQNEAQICRAARTTVECDTQLRMVHLQGNQRHI